MNNYPGTSKTDLNNGVKIITKQMPYVRSVTMGIWVNAGSRDETLAENGLSHLIEHLIFKGTEKRTAFQIAKAFDDIGGQTNAFTTMENTCFHAKVMDSHLETMVEVMSDIFLNSLFDEEEVLKERPVILQEIGMVEDSPDEYIHVLSGKHFWGDHPLGRSILGTRENILRFDAETIKHFFQRLYQPDRIIISASGNVDHQKFVNLIGPAFESIRKIDDFPERKTPAGNTNVNLKSRKLEQTHICIGINGLPTGHPLRYGFSLMSTLLGGNMSSRLFQDIREKRGLAYTVYSFVSTHVDGGMFGAYAAVDPVRAAETAHLLVDHIHHLKENRVQESELGGAKEYIKGNLLLSSESSENQMVRLAQNEMHFERQVPLQEVIEKIDAVTTDDIQDIADRLFSHSKTSLTVLGRIKGKSDYDNILNPLTNS
ncbi:MAG: insulinase family protein [Deltaproteobacteria bacterium]|nr:MAG: insulinase family protein [Deltaproteobacteria bacterium]HHE74067.1 insulinase family protein [Desulfobacteraceae bacterium]